MLENCKKKIRAQSERDERKEKISKVTWLDIGLTSTTAPTTETTTSTTTTTCCEFFCSLLELEDDWMGAIESKTIKLY